MNSLSADLYKKILTLSTCVNDNLKRKGIAIPSKNDDGSISLGNYVIIKNNNFFFIQDYKKENIIEKINLPQTAILLANKLALGKFIDNSILQNDRYYGYAEFEEKLYTMRIKKNIENSLLFEVKLCDAKLKKEFYKKTIRASFEKLYQNI